MGARPRPPAGDSAPVARRAAYFRLRCLVALLAALAGVTPVRAQSAGTVLSGLPAPIVRINLRQGDVIVGTGSQPAVSIDAPPSVAVTRFSAGGQRAAGDVPLPIFAGEIEGPNGPVVLPAETFVVSTLPAGPRDVVDLRGEGGVVHVTIPQTTALLVVQIGRGRVEVDGYHNGTIIARVRGGSIVFRDAGGDAFAQVLRGPTYIADSNFNRLRARSGLGNIVLERSGANQIQVSSVDGSIVDDAASFAPGLARFESQHGSVAIGAAGPVQLQGQTAGGRVFTAFNRAATVDNRQTTANAIVQ
ncbi:MAG: hypothetical protein ACREM8_15140, partial [Vulcanimicrobiaceae bacterium]